MFHKTEKERGYSIMKKAWFALLVLTFLLVTTTSNLSGQGYFDEACVVTLEGQNKNRIVAGAVNTECHFPHTPPWGNWGVDSNYGHRTDTDQFRGWKYKDNKKQWNSCTTHVAEYQPPNSTYYNNDGYTTQRSTTVVKHGRTSYRTNVTVCSQGGGAGSGCSGLSGASQTSNYMKLWELDSNDADEQVETLYFPSTSVTFTGCTTDECPEQESNWVQMTGSSHSLPEVEAALRMKAVAYLDGSCEDVDWDW